MSAFDIQPAVHIGQVIRNAVAFNIRHWREASVNTDSLLETVNRLFAVLHERQVDYLLVGGVALRQCIEGLATSKISI